MDTTTKVVDREYLKRQFKNYNDTLVKPAVDDLDDRKVDKVAGKGLSKNDFTDELKTKLEDLNIEFETDPIDFYNLDSDEFTYTKTPGTISKLFVHLFRNPVYFGENAVDLRNDDGYVVDADGVVRYEFGSSSYGNSIYKIDDNSDIVAVFNTNLTTESLLDNMRYSLLDNNNNADAYDKLLDDISKDESGKFSGMNANSETITLSTRDELKRLIQSALDNTDTPSDHKYYNDDTENNTISVSPRSRHAFILSSDKLFAKSNMASGGSPDGIPMSGYYGFDEASYQISYVLQEWNNSDYRQDTSYGFHGLSIIEKALETGRALDIGIDITDLNVSWWIIN